MLAAESSITTSLILSFGLYSYKSLRIEIESRSLVSGFARWLILVNRDRYVTFSGWIYSLYNLVTVNTQYKLSRGVLYFFALIARLFTENGISQRDWNHLNGNKKLVEKKRVNHPFLSFDLYTYVDNAMLVHLLFPTGWRLAVTWPILHLNWSASFVITSETLPYSFLQSRYDVLVSSYLTIHAVTENSIFD